MSDDHDGPRGDRLRVRELAWSALLGQWMDFARASLVLPDEGEGGRWKRAVPSIIELQATVCALRDLASIEPADRPWARDRAELVVRRASAELSALWPDEGLPAQLVELQHDATIALREALYAGLVELVWPGPGLLEVPDYDPGPPRGTLLAMQPGSIALPDEPVAAAVDRPLPTIAGCVERPGGRPRQVYRELDAEGRFVAAIVAPLEGELPAGLPMLVPISLDGTVIGSFLHEREAWLRLQRSALAGRTTLPVRVID